jgi:hypothetical protein
MKGRGGAGLIINLNNLYVIGSEKIIFRRCQQRKGIK